MKFKAFAYIFSIVFGSLSIFGLAQAVVEPGTGSNYVDVASCRQDGKDIMVKRLPNGVEFKLTSTLRDAGHGMRYYTLNCVSQNRYFVSWKEASSTTTSPVVTIPAPQVVDLYVYDSSRGVGIAKNAQSYQDAKTFVEPSVVNVSDTVSALDFSMQISNLDKKFTFGFVWTDNIADSVHFDEGLVKSLASRVVFVSPSKQKIIINDYYKGKYIMLVGFVRNNDGVSQVPNMPVEVDDVVAVYLKTASTSSVSEVIHGAPKIVSPIGRQILTNFPRIATLKWDSVAGASSYAIELACDTCGKKDYQAILRFTASTTEFTTPELWGDNVYRYRVQGVAPNGSKGPWSTYAYFRYKTGGITNPTPDTTKPQAFLKVLDTHEIGNGYSYRFLVRGKDTSSAIKKMTLQKRDTNTTTWSTVYEWNWSNPTSTAKEVELQHPTTTLPYGSTYLFQLIVEDSAGNTVTSEQLRVVVPISGIDSDNDGLSDEREKTLGTDPFKKDTDADELSDGDEVLVWKSNPLKADTDGDRYPDGIEVRYGYNPNGSGTIF